MKDIRSKKGIRISFTKLRDILIMILGIILIINLVLMFNFNSALNEKILEQKEKTRAANITLKIIDCEDCYDISSIVSSIKNSNVNILEEENLDINDDIIEEYDIERLPTIIIGGEIDRLNLNGFENKNNALIFTDIKAPFFDVKENKVKGLVSLKYIRCDKCYDLNPFITSLVANKVAIVNEEAINLSNADEFINEYSLEKLPTVILSSDFQYYDIAKDWDNLGTIEEDGSYVLRDKNNLLVPYYDVNESKIKGLVDIIYLYDEECDECYDVNLHKNVLRNIGVIFNSERNVSISSDEGVDLIDKYDIEKIPTIILSEEANEYIALVNAWQQVGSFEEDNSLVFRNTELMGAYKDLTTNEIVKAQSSA